MAKNTSADGAGRQRWGAYAVMVRGDEILLSRLAPRITQAELWTLPGGGIEYGEHPRDALVREIHEETGLDATVGEQAFVLDGWSRWSEVEQHAIRLIYDAWVGRDAPDPAVVEVDGSTVEARWHAISDVRTGRVPLAGWVREALARHRPVRLQRLAAYGVAVRGAEVLLTRISRRGHAPGTWTLPGGGVGHGESPRDALAREFREETGLGVEVGMLLGVHDVHFTGTAPTGRNEDFHGVHLVHSVTVGEGAPWVTQTDGTTDAVQWIPIDDVLAGRVAVLDVVREGLRLIGSTVAP